MYISQWPQISFMEETEVRLSIEYCSCSLTCLSASKTACTLFSVTSDFFMQSFVLVLALSGFTAGLFSSRLITCSFDISWMEVVETDGCLNRPINRLEKLNANIVTISDVFSKIGVITKGSNWVLKGLECKSV